MSRILFQMNAIGKTIRSKRKELGLLLRQVAAQADIDQAILSKIERNERKPTKKVLCKLSEILDLDEEKLLVEYFSDRIVSEIMQEDCAEKALEVAERKIKYLRTRQIESSDNNSKR